MVKILGLAGKKQSGKNTSANFILGVHMIHLGYTKSMFIDDGGQLNIGDLWGEEEYKGVFDVNRRYEPNNDTMVNFLEKCIFPYVKLYSFADPLKRLCIDIMGLHSDQCYLTDAHKNTLTDYKWSDMPTVEKNDPTHDVDAYMSAREVLQYIGTNIFRRMYYNVWVDVTLRQVEQEQTELAVITDCRFPNEVEGIQKVGGKVIKFTRNPLKDSHESELALNNLSNDKFDFILDNAKMTIKEQNKEVYRALRAWNYIPEIGE